MHAEDVWIELWEQVKCFSRLGSKVSGKLFILGDDEFPFSFHSKNLIVFKQNEINI